MSHEWRWHTSNKLCIVHACIWAHAWLSPTCPQPSWSAYCSRLHQCITHVSLSECFEWDGVHESSFQPVNCDAYAWVCKRQQHRNYNFALSLALGIHVLASMFHVSLLCTTVRADDESRKRCVIHRSTVPDLIRIPIWKCDNFLVKNEKPMQMRWFSSQSHTRLFGLKTANTMLSRCWVASIEMFRCIEVYFYSFRLLQSNVHIWQPALWDFEW